jgi:hypothetical protein
MATARENTKMLSVVTEKQMQHFTVVVTYEAKQMRRKNKM